LTEPDQKAATIVVVLRRIKMSRKTVSNFKKVRLILSSLQENVIVTKFCKEHGIPRSTFYRWRKLVLAGLAAFISGDKKEHRGRKAVDGAGDKVKPYRCRRK
jgi:transposase-like protein